MNDIPDPHDKTLSKTKRKEASQALQQLGLALSKLPNEARHALPLDNYLRAELERLRKITSHVARKRQMLFVGKLLRREDPEPLFAALERHTQQGREQVARQHRAEHWRDHLLNQGDAALTTLVEADPQADRQAIRQLLRQARLETEREKPPVAARKLFRVLHTLDMHQTLPPVPEDNN